MSKSRCAHHSQIYSSYIFVRHCFVVPIHDLLVVVLILLTTALHGTHCNWTQAEHILINIAHGLLQSCYRNMPLQ